MRDVEIDKIKDYASEDADITLQLKQVFEPQLKEKEVEKVFYEVENPLVKVLTAMEFEGIRIDTEFLNDYSKQLEKEAKTVKKEYANKLAFVSIWLRPNNWEKCCLISYN